MFARVSTYSGPAGLSDQDVENITKQTTENVLPTVEKMEGFKGVMQLLDRETGKALSITLWESQEAMRASEEGANTTREQAAQISRSQVQNVERYEVTFSQLS